jgi:hypothetical protein
MQNKTLEAILLEGPAHPPPPGYVPNYNNPHNLRTFSAATLAICLIITTSMTFMRMYVKIFTVKRVNIEDCKLNLYSNV